MKKSFFFPRYSSVIGFLAITLSFTCKKQADFEAQNLYFNFQLSVEKIKQELNVNDKLTTVYFQRIYLSNNSNDNFTTALFHGEFLSSQSIIYFNSPTYALEDYILPSSELNPERISFTLESKASDTIYYYLDYSYKYTGEQISMPVACITPEGSILPLHGYNKYARYLEEKIKIFICDISNGVI